MGSVMMAEANQHAEAGVFSTGRLSLAKKDRGQRRAANVPLWIIQGLLALLFLLAGVMKLVLPVDVLTAQLPLPGAFGQFGLFVRLVGTAEVLGAIGLILPGLLRIRPGLTPLAAAGLVIIMTGATTLTLAAGEVAPALVPLTVGMLAASVAYGRGRAVRPLS